MAITEVIHQLLVAQQLEAVQFSRTVHEIYTGLSLSEADEADIVARTAELLCAPVVLEDVRHRVLAHADAHLEDWINRSKFVGYLQHTGRATGAENWPQTPVGAARRRWGRLIVPAQLQDDDRAALVLERAGQALTIARLSGRDERELLYQTRTATLHELAAGHSYSEKELSIRTQALGLAPAAYYVPVVISTSAAASATETQLADRALLEELDQLADSMHLGILAGLRKPGYLSILLPVRARELIDSTLQGFTRRLAEQPGRAGGHRRGARRHPGRGDHRAGTSGRRWRKSCRTCPPAPSPTTALPTCACAGCSRPWAATPRMRTFAHAELASLLNPVDEPALDLLELYLAHSGNKSALAKAGYLSRPTLYSRLAKLEAKLGVVLDSAESRASLQVALLWYRMHG
ncbi:helix-turn-helix domain-containing protein [Glutamicibacter halophytocola]|uniref:helix-turn-helix domain-containing protein n=1 Tax=Glutamicibacter halophytocola TaxID=1933880 RepID=UPI003219BB35